MKLKRSTVSRKPPFSKGGRAEAPLITPGGPGYRLKEMELDIVSLSRLQFAITALYHFLFVPLTLGLSVLLAIMETVYVMTGRLIWRQMTKFWGTLFGINFVMGVATGVVMEFQFGMNWSYYSHYVGDIFGAPLAIEGLMAFFLEATFVGLFFFGWDRLSKVGHLMATYAVAAGSNFSALWILIANGWMQNPVGSAFNPETMRMEITDFFAVLMNPVAQAKFVHTVSAGYVTASVFVLGVSAWYLLKGRSVELAKRSMTIAASFGLAATLSVVVLGDESGYLANEHQKMKIAAIEAMWETEPAPASFTVFGFPDQAARETHFAVHIPWVMGLIGTRSLTTPIQGINDLVESAENHIRNGIVAYDALQKIRAAGDTNAVPQEVKDVFADNSQWMGYALLLKRYVDDPRQATDAQITQAANDTVPGVLPLFWALSVPVADCRVCDTATVDRSRNGLDRRGVWPPAMGYRRHIADGSWGFQSRSIHSAADHTWFRGDLYGSLHHRDGPDDPCYQGWT